MSFDRTLSGFIAAHSAEIVSRWADHVVALLSLDAGDRPQLVNDMPTFLDDLVTSLQTSIDRVQYRGGARSHGRQRKEIGLDIGALAIEFALVGETVLELADEQGFSPSLSEVRAMLRVIAQGTDHSVTTYAALRDREIEEQAARHYSFVAHELRTPLQNASLATTLLSRGHGDSEAQIDRIARALQQVTSVIDSSLVETRLRGSPAPRYELLDARRLAADVVEACSFAAERRSVSVAIECPEFEIEADRKLVSSVLINLVSNAIKFTRDGGHVSLQAALIEGRARFEVADECGGMPDDLPGRLFQPHVQEGSDRSGFGLGLAIVKRAVDAHHGAIRVANRPGVGCCFIVDLPARKPELTD